MNVLVITILILLEITVGLNAAFNDLQTTEITSMKSDSEMENVNESYAISDNDIPLLDNNGLPIDYFAETGDAQGYVFHLWDLASAKPKNLPLIFIRSVDPNITDFRGNQFQGIVLYINNLYFGKCLFTLYTGIPLDIFTGKTFSQALTFQKRFYEQDNENGESGINYWPVRSETYLPMKIYISPSLQDISINSLKIDYNVNSNEDITQKPLIDEVRQIPGSDLYIGKMYFRLGNFPLLVLWFAIELENYSS